MAKEETAAPTIDPTDIWGRIPPEEKFELMARAQARGVGAGLLLVVLGATLAVGFKFDWLMWGALLLSPLLFQFVAGKTWRAVRPLVMLEYLAARSAARRYAFTNKSQDLYLQLIFRGKLQALGEDTSMDTQIAETFDKFEKTDVWVALFNDCIVMISERLGGADCAFAQLLDKNLVISGESPEGGSDYSNERQIMLTVTTKKGDKLRYRLVSKYPAALVVFEKKALELQKAKLATMLGAGSPAAAPVDDDFLEKWGQEA